jgi:hypothetical protein
MQRYAPRLRPRTEKRCLAVRSLILPSVRCDKPSRNTVPFRTLCAAIVGGCRLFRTTDPVPVVWELTRGPFPSSIRPRRGALHVRPLRRGSAPFASRLPCRERVLCAPTCLRGPDPVGTGLSGERVPLRGEYLPLQEYFLHPRKSRTAVSALLAAGQMTEFTSRVGPSRALSKDGPMGRNLFMEGFQMAKKKLKKSK